MLWYSELEVGAAICASVFCCITMHKYRSLLLLLLHAKTNSTENTMKLVSYFRTALAENNKLYLIYTIGEAVSVTSTKNIVKIASVAVNSQGND